MEGNCRIDLRPLAGFQHRPQLVRLAPYATVMAHEDRIVSELPCREARKQPLSFLRQHNVTRLPCLALAYRDDAGIGVEIRNVHASQFRVAAPRQQRATDKIAERRLASVDQPHALGLRLLDKVYAIVDKGGKREVKTL